MYFLSYLALWWLPTLSLWLTAPHSTELWAQGRTLPCVEQLHRHQLQNFWDNNKAVLWHSEILLELSHQRLTEVAGYYQLTKKGWLDKINSFVVFYKNKSGSHGGQSVWGLWFIPTSGPILSRHPLLATRYCSSRLCDAALYLPDGLDTSYNSHG